MPIIAATGRRHWRVRILIGGIYALLVAGSLTMLYPFGMMLSMSVSSNCDNMEQQLVPRYIKERLAGGVPEALFRKYASVCYPRIEDFNRRHRSRYVDYSYGLRGRTATGIYARFQRIRPVPFGLDDRRFRRLTDDALNFKTWYALGSDPAGVMPDTSARLLNMPLAYRTLRSQNTLNPTLDSYVEWLKERYGTLADVNEVYREESRTWSDVMMPVEQPDLVTWLPDTRSLKVRDFNDFKEQLARRHINFLTFPDLNYHTLFSREYNSEDRYYRQTGKWIATFYELKVPPHAPPVEIPDERFRDFFKSRFETLANVNLLYGTAFASWEEITFPRLPPWGAAERPAALPLVSSFVRYGLEQKTHGAFRAFLENKYSERERFEAVHGVPLPQQVRFPEYHRARVALEAARKQPALLSDNRELAGYVRTLETPSFGIADAGLEAALVSELAAYAADVMAREAAAEAEGTQEKEVDPQARYRQFFASRFGAVETLNYLYGTSFAGWDDLRLPADGEPPSEQVRQAPLLATFLKRATTLASDGDFREFLKRRYPEPEAFARKYGLETSALSDTTLPYHRRAEMVLDYPCDPEVFADIGRFRQLVAAATGPVFGVADAAHGQGGEPARLEQALLAELLHFAYAEFCSKERDLWVEFVRNNCPLRFLIIRDADEKYRRFLKDKYGGDVERLLAVYRQGLEAADAGKVAYRAFDDITFPGEVYPRNPDGTFFFHRPIADDVLAFMKSEFIDPIRDVTVATPEYWWGRYLKEKYGGAAEAARAHSHQFAAFADIRLTAELPRQYPQALQDAWYEFVSGVLPLEEVRLSRGNLALFRNYLRDAVYNGDVGALNAACGTGYAGFEDVEFPAAPTEAALADARAFLASKQMSPYEVYVKDVRAAEGRFQDFLSRRFGGDREASHLAIERLNAACLRYSDLAAPALPYDELEWRDFNEYWRAKQRLFWRFLLGNYRVVLGFLTLHGRALFNTFVFCLASILIHTTINPMCAYALSRFRLSYGHYILLFLLATMSFPPMVTMIPNFLMLKSLGLLNTYWALVLPGAANGYSIFLLKGFFDSLPQELFEAGIIDGASEVQMFYRLAMPLSYPILAVIALWAFTGAYGAFMFAFIVCQDPKLWTLMVFLYEFQQEHATQLTMAALALASVPTLLVFILAQRVILRGIVIPQMK